MTNHWETSAMSISFRKLIICGERGKIEIHNGLVPDIAGLIIAICLQAHEQAVRVLSDLSCSLPPHEHQSIATQISIFLSSYVLGTADLEIDSFFGTCLRGCCFYWTSWNVSLRKEQSQCRFTHLWAPKSSPKKVFSSTLPVLRFSLRLRLAFPSFSLCAQLSCVSTSHHARRSFESFRSLATVCKYWLEENILFSVVSRCCCCLVAMEKEKNSSLCWCT